MSEGQHLDRKSLRSVTGHTADWHELAKDCVCFANAQGGVLLIGIEGDAAEASVGQTVAPELLDAIRKRIGELTVNVQVATAKKRSSNGGEYIELRISRSLAPASTTDGRYYMRVADDCKPLVGDDIQRLLNERSLQSWESLTTLAVPRDRADPTEVERLAAGVRASSRVKASVKEKSDDELLDHYLLADSQHLTNVGVLCVGRREDRARLGTASVVQFLKLDDQGRKVNKLVWDDFEFSPMQLVDEVWRGIPDFRERYEMPDGLFRQYLPLYDEEVIRELLVNALVHRPYTQRGDIFVNLHPDRLQVVNPGLLPLGVTPENVLHTTVRRNEGLARVFHDLGLMEREGSGFDRMYEVLLAQGRRPPTLREGPDRVEVTVERRILNDAVIDFMTKVDRTYQPSQRQKIALGMLAQNDGMTARELADHLHLRDVEDLRPWLDALLDLELVGKVGQTKGTRYFVDSQLMRSLDFEHGTTLARIELHRLEALVTEDLGRHPGSKIGEIHSRIGEEIPRNRLRYCIRRLVDGGKVIPDGEKGGRTYRIGPERRESL
jgi:ATP-dependent DNA helicase RecG